MIRLLMFACLAFTVILLFQSDLSASEHQAQTIIRLAQDDSGKAKAPDPATTPDTGSEDDSGTPSQDQE